MEVLGSAVSNRAVGIGPKGSGGADGIVVWGTDAGTAGTVDGGAEDTGGGTGEAGAGGSPVCSAIGDRSPRGPSSASSSSSDPGGGRWKARGRARHLSRVRTAS